MERPFKYTIWCNKTNTILSQTNIAPLLHELKTWENTDKPNVKVLEQTRTCYVDTRYDAKLRLFNYITYIKNGLEIPKYNPFKNTKIGKTIPILNF